MKLTRRDALVALGLAGAGAGAAGRLSVDAGDRAEQLAAVADVVYPSAVEVTPEFVASLLGGYLSARPDYAVALDRALGALDRAARARHGRSLVALSPDERESLLRALGADRVAPDPEGSVPERVRYYVVDGLLFALFTSPTGGRLVGTENPVGYPGGRETYQRRPVDPQSAGGAAPSTDE